MNLKRPLYLSLILLTLGGCQSSKQPTIIPEPKPQVQVIVIKEPTIESEKVGLIEVYEYAANNFKDLKEGMEYIKPRVKKIVSGPNFEYWRAKLEKLSETMYDDYKQKKSTYDIFMNAARYIENQQR